MKIKKIFILILFFASIHAIAFGKSEYNYYKYRHYYNKAQMALYKKDYKESQKYFEKSFNYMKQEQVVNLCYADYVECLLNRKDTIAAINAEAKYLAQGLINVVSVNSTLKKFGIKYGNDLIRQFPRIKEECENLPDRENRFAIAELVKTDQEIRNMRESMPLQEFEKLLVFSDSVNFYKLYRLVKENNANPQCQLMYHIYGSNRKYFNLYDSIFKTMVFKGEASPEAYVFWYDRQRMYVDGLKTQLYGEWNSQGNGSTEFNPIEDIQNVDERRSKFGLCSLKDYALLNNMKLPKDYSSSKKKN